MQIILNIIAIFAIVASIARFIAILFIKHINHVERIKLTQKDKNIKDINPIYYLSCDKCLWDRANEFDAFYLIPTVSFYICITEFNINITWLKWSYNISYYYKRAND